VSLKGAEAGEGVRRRKESPEKEAGESAQDNSAKSKHFFQAHSFQ